MTACVIVVERGAQVQVFEAAARVPGVLSLTWEAFPGLMALMA